MYSLPNFPQRTIGQYHNWDFLDSRGSWEVPDLRKKKLQGIVCYLPLEGLSSVRTWRMWSCIRDPWLQVTEIGADSRCSLRSLTYMRTPWGPQDAKLFLTWPPGLWVDGSLSPSAESAQILQLTGQALESPSPRLDSQFLTYYMVDLGQWSLRASVSHNILYSTYHVSVVIPGTLYNNSFNTNNPQKGNIIISSYFASEEIEAQRGYLPKVTQLENNGFGYLKPGHMHHKSTYINHCLILLLLSCELASVVPHWIFTRRTA